MCPDYFELSASLDNYKATNSLSRWSCLSRRHQHILRDRSCRYCWPELTLRHFYKWVILPQANLRSFNQDRITQSFQFILRQSTKRVVIFGNQNHFVAVDETWRELLSNFPMTKFIHVAEAYVWRLTSAATGQNVFNNIPAQFIAVLLEICYVIVSNALIRASQQNIGFQKTFVVQLFQH